ncbi:MAG: NAD(P)-dependent oxidoreductase [Euryarchaeota archaeon]|nr:NAD(P)-dependent oxidoreductase [Euryarchaeota archaeon]MBT4406315.1 NAD(P)-dependent oxidoreductase [Euryarchaeota archaeon]MBT6644614.1 NAD(P)-dependent oxidoreductase [Euryarchaeota archaeon]
MPYLRLAPLMPRIIITGSCGLIGGLVYDALKELGHEVFGIDRPHSDRISRGRNIDDKEALNRLDLALDISTISVNSLAKIFKGHDQIIHLAADADPSNWGRSMLEVNIVGTHTVLKAAKQVGIKRIVIASSGLSQVTLERQLIEGGNLHGKLIGIEDGVGIDSPYGLSKIVGEELGRAFASSSMEVISVRIGTVIPDDTEHVRRGGRLMATAFLQQDVINFFIAATHNELPANQYFLLTAAQSNSPTRFVDLEPGLSSLGWTPLDWQEWLSVYEG